MIRKNPIYVTQPSLPPFDEFIPHLKKIWTSHHLTNSGPYHQNFELALAARLGVEHISLFTNGTMGLLTALQSLGITGEVITTPFSFVVTSHVLLWNRLRPVFVDIDPVTLNLDPSKIESSITSDTTAILPVHVYGRPCDVQGIEDIASSRNLRVIYDAAHAFGVRYKDKPLLAYGDMSVLSFHATKVFNTFEGGAVTSSSAEKKLHLDRLKNFGIVDETTVVDSGINGKMNEFQAALGLIQLKYIEDAIDKRRSVDNYYRAALGNCAGIKIPIIMPDTQSNYSYFPILVTSEYPLSRDALNEHLRANGIFARRYFYPLISELSMYQQFPSSARSNLPNAYQISREILCLPIYPNLAHDDVGRICDLIRERA